MFLLIRRLPPGVKSPPQVCVCQNLLGKSASVTASKESRLVTGGYSIERRRGYKLPDIFLSFVLRDLCVWCQLKPKKTDTICIMLYSRVSEVTS